MTVNDQLVPTCSPLTAGHPWPGAGADRTALSLIAFLEANGAGEMRHAAGRSLLDHLVETSAIVRRWGQPDWIAHAALLHSVYGTDRYRQQLLPLSSRGRVREVAGSSSRADRLPIFCGAPGSAAGRHVSLGAGAARRRRRSHQGRARRAGASAHGQSWLSSSAPMMARPGSGLQECVSVRSY